MPRRCVRKSTPRVSHQPGMVFAPRTLVFRIEAAVVPDVNSSTACGSALTERGARRNSGPALRPGKIGPFETERFADLMHRIWVEFVA
jgi:hypothetical protein